MRQPPTCRRAWSQRILRLTAHLYEHREILVDGPAFSDLELDATDWMPRV